MKEIRCVNCGYIIKNEKKCPLCGSIEFEIGDEMTHFKTTDYNAVTIYDDNPCIERIEGCINCGICSKTCIEREKMKDDEKCLVCVGCGQCIITCPKKIIQPKNNINKFLEAKKQGKICIVSIAPATRTSIGDVFGYEKGEYLEKKLVGLLRKLGFDYVFDITFGADITIMEEANELLKRIEQNNLPMLTSCCPAWVRYAEIFYPEIISNISTTKSPIAIQNTIIKEYFLPLKKIKEEDVKIFNITPCTAKKGESERSELNSNDIVITISELVDYLKKKEIDFEKIEESNFDDILGKGSGAGLIFGNTGGVMESALRTLYYLDTGKEIDIDTLKPLRTYNGIKELEIKIKNKILKVAAIDEIGNAIPILESIKNNTCKYDFIEIMNCRGGCIGGGGQPIYKRNEEDEIKKKRIESLYNEDKNMKIRYSYQNKDIKRIYDNFLEKPLSEKAVKLLHTTYHDKSNILNERKN